jgi:hypothetical protein
MKASERERERGRASESVSVRVCLSLHVGFLARLVYQPIPVIPFKLMQEEQRRTLQDLCRLNFAAF